MHHFFFCRRNGRNNKILHLHTTSIYKYTYIKKYIFSNDVNQVTNNKWPKNLKMASIGFHVYVDVYLDVYLDVNHESTDRHIYTHKAL